MSSPNTEAESFDVYTTRAPEALDILEPAKTPGGVGRLAHYEVQKVLGKGAFGTVVKAFDERLQREVAIKILDAKHGPNSAAGVRFVREARAAAGIRHANVVQIYAVEERPNPYLVMEYVPGESVQELLARRGRLPAVEAVAIGIGVARGLAAAHDRGLIHRDLKPANILVETVRGVPQAKLADFGLAVTAADVRLTQAGLIVGTPLYMSPEQTRGEELDPRSDLFSLGGVLYAMLAGTAPFDRSETVAVLQQINMADPKPLREAAPDAPAGLAAVIDKLLAKRPEDRYSTAIEVATALVGVSRELPTDVVVSHTATPPARKPKSTWWWIGPAAVGLVGLIGVGVVAFRAGRTTADPVVLALPTDPEQPPLPPLPGGSYAALLTSPEYAWAVPVNLGPGVNTDQKELWAALSRDERVLVFHRGNRLYECRRADPTAPFQDAVPLPDAINRQTNQSPSLSGDGRLLAFQERTSNRESHVWLVRRATTADPFADPKRVPARAGRATAPVLAEDGRTLLLTDYTRGDIVALTRADWDQSFEAEQPWMSAVNGGHYDAAGWLSPDGLALIRVVQVKDQPEGCYLHTRATAADPFGPGIRFDPFAGRQVGHPWVSADGRRMYFHSRDFGGSGDQDLWVSELRKR